MQLQRESPGVTRSDIMRAIASMRLSNLSLAPSNFRGRANRAPCGEGEKLSPHTFGPRPVHAAVAGVVALFSKRSVTTSIEIRKFLLQLIYFPIKVQSRKFSETKLRHKRRTHHIHVRRTCLLHSCTNYRHLKA